MFIINKKIELNQFIEFKIFLELQKKKKYALHSDKSNFVKPILDDTY